MSFTDLLTGIRNCEPPRDAAEAQKKWVERGTVSEDYLRCHAQRSFSNSPEGMEAAVREALQRSQEMKPR